MRTRGFLLLIWGWVLVLTMTAGEPRRQGGGARQPRQTTRWNEVPAQDLDLILGRPTSNSVTVSVRCARAATGVIAYGTQPGKLAAETPRTDFTAGECQEVVLGNLQPDTRYYYAFRSAQVAYPEYSFHTARARESSYVFTVTADSHLDEQTDPRVYERTLAHALADTPDFHVDLGDTFMTEKHGSREAALGQYVAQRYYLGQLACATPLFLVLGNHDGESLRGRPADGDALAVWSNQTRKRFFPNPTPDGFYSGNAAPHPEAGLLQDYYAWEWGDALFVVLDPSWHTPRSHGSTDGWNHTLGAAQYRWLEQTLRMSRARFRFVFIHNLVGGVGGPCRGGAEAAPFFEWGGRSAEGPEGFKDHRPGWTAPIHSLLVQNQVSVVFHGHDHLYAQQELDGVVYQAVPQPGHPGGTRVPPFAAEYGYQRGTVLGGSGYLRVAVSNSLAQVDYVLTEANGPGRVAHSYRLQPR